MATRSAELVAATGPRQPSSIATSCAGGVSAASVAKVNGGNSAPLARKFRLSDMFEAYRKNFGAAYILESLWGFTNRIFISPPRGRERSLRVGVRASSRLRNPKSLVGSCVERRRGRTDSGLRRDACQVRKGDSEIARQRVPLLLP